MEMEFIAVSVSQEGKGQVYRLKEPNPFAGEESGQVASVAYRLASENSTYCTCTCMIYTLNKKDNHYKIC